MKTLDPRALAGMVFVAIVAVAAAWFFLRTDRPVVAQVATPQNTNSPSNSPAVEVAKGEGSNVRDLEVMGAQGTDEAVKRGGKPEVVMPEGVPHTDRCRLIAGWAQRHVPHYTILDNIRDGSMRFTTEDRNCLAAAKDVPPIVVDFADRYKKSKYDLR